jgi:hypothetical protein
MDKDTEAQRSFTSRVGENIARQWWARSLILELENLWP